MLQKAALSGSLLLFCFMMRNIFVIILLSIFSISAYAQQADSSRLRVSLLTCGPGDEIWSHFGHIAIRVVDSNAGTDVVFNYGTFSFGEEAEFAIKFMRGKLPYYVSYYPYVYFLDEYRNPDRRVEEQVLLVGNVEKEAIYDYLKENAKEENRYYKYDFFFDNCSSRIRDVFQDALGSNFQYGQTLPEGSELTYRQIMNEYFYSVHFVRLGCNLLLGKHIDDVMTNKDVMFLPDFLRDGLAGATVNGKSVATPTEVLIEGSGKEPAGLNWPFIIFSIVAAITITALVTPGMKPVANVMMFLHLFVTGLLGCLMLVMWLWTDHQGCSDNFNILWALPTNLIFAFVPKRNKQGYSYVAIILIFISLLLHIFRVQQLPLLELSPLLLVMLFIYGTIIKRSKQNG